MSQFHINADSLRIDDVNSGDGYVIINPPADEVGVNLIAPKPTSPQLGGTMVLGISVNGASPTFANEFGVVPITAASSSGTVTTANNGLTKTSDNIQLGGNLVKNTSINALTFPFEIIGIGAGTTFEKVFKVSYTGSQSTGSAISGETTNAGTGVLGRSDNGTGVEGIGVYGVRGKAVIEAGAAVSGESALGSPHALLANKTTFGTGSGLRINFQGGNFNPNNGCPIDVNQFGNTEGDYFRILTGGAALGTHSFRVRSFYNSGGATNNADLFTIDAIKNNITNVLSADLSIKVANNTTLNEIIKLKGTGAIQLPFYGDGVITGTPTFGAGFDINGNLIEVALGSGGSPEARSSYIEVVIGSTEATSLGLIDGATTYTNANLIGKQVEVQRDLQNIPSIPWNGNTYFTKVLGDDFLTLSDPLSTGQLIKIKIL